MPVIATRRSLSPEAFRQMFAQEQDDPFLMCLTLTHANLAEPVRLVRNNVSIDRASGKYLACYFDMNLPQDTSDGPPQVQLTVDNVSRSLSRTLATLEGRVKVTVEVVLSSQPDSVEVGPMDFWILSATYDAEKIACVLGMEDDVLNQAFPAQQYNPENTPGVFR